MLGVRYVTLHNFTVYYWFYLTVLPLLDKHALSYKNGNTTLTKLNRTVSL